MRMPLLMPVVLLLSPLFASLTIAAPLPSSRTSTIVKRDVPNHEIMFWRQLLRFAMNENPSKWRQARNFVFNGAEDSRGFEAKALAEPMYDGERYMTSEKVVEGLAHLETLPPVLMAQVKAKYQLILLHEDQQAIHAAVQIAMMELSLVKRAFITGESPFRGSMNLDATPAMKTFDGWVKPMIQRYGIWRNRMGGQWAPYYVNEGATDLSDSVRDDLRYYRQKPRLPQLRAEMAMKPSNKRPSSDDENSSSPSKRMRLCRRGQGGCGVEQNMVEHHPNKPTGPHSPRDGPSTSKSTSKSHASGGSRAATGHIG